MLIKHTLTMTHWRMLGRYMALTDQEAQEIQARLRVKGPQARL